MQIFVTDFDFPPQNKKSGLYFYAKVREAPEKSWSEIAKKGASKEVGSVCLSTEPVVGCEAATWVT